MDIWDQMFHYFQIRFCELYLLGIPPLYIPVYLLLCVLYSTAASQVVKEKSSFKQVTVDPKATSQASVLRNESQTRFACIFAI